MACGFASGSNIYGATISAETERCGFFHTAFYPDVSGFSANLENLRVQADRAAAINADAGKRLQAASAIYADTGANSSQTVASPI